MRASLPLILAFAATIPAGAFALEWSHRRGQMARLHAVLDSDRAASPHYWPADLLLWLGSHIPGASDPGLKRAVLRAGYFHPAALTLVVGLRALLVAAVMVAALAR